MRWRCVAALRQAFAEFQALRGDRPLPVAQVLGILGRHSANAVAAMCALELNRLWLNEPERLVASCFKDERGLPNYAARRDELIRAVAVKLQRVQTDRPLLPQTRALSASPLDNGGNKAAKVQELAAKPESFLQSEQVTQTIDTWAHWLPASKQVLDDVAQRIDAQLRGRMGSVRRALRRHGGRLVEPFVLGATACGLARRWQGEQGLRGRIASGPSPNEKRPAVPGVFLGVLPTLGGSNRAARRPPRRSNA